MAKFEPRAAKSHQQYHNSKGKRLPGVTTITGLFDKGGLVRWAAGLHKKGIEYEAYMAEAAGVGSCAHAMIQSAAHGQKVDLGQFSGDQISWATECALKVVDGAALVKSGMTITENQASRIGWFSVIGFELMESETQLVSEKLQVGGTFDLYGKTAKGSLALGDIKTSDSGIYLENCMQVVAYTAMAIENGYEVQYCFVVRAAKDDAQKVDVKLIKVNSREYRGLLKGFKALRGLYEDARVLRKKLGVR